MSDFKTHLQSALQTFIATMLVLIGAQLNAHLPIVWTATFWFPLLFSAGRAAVKVLFENYAPATLGGKK